MKKLLLALVLVLATAVPCLAEFEFGQGEGSLAIVTLQQRPEFPLPVGQQLAVEWFSFRGGREVALAWSRGEHGGAMLSFCSDPKAKTRDDGFEMMCMTFHSAGLVARYNYNKKTETFINGQVVFNGNGKFFIVDCDENGKELTDSSFVECGEAGIQGSISINRNGIGTLQGTTVQGGNFGFLWRGNLSGRIDFNHDEVN